MLRSELKIWPNARWTGCSTAATAASNFGPLAVFRTKRLVKRGDSPRCLRCSFCVYGESHLFVARPAERQASVYLLLLGLIGNKVFHSRFCRQSAAAGDHDETTTSWGLACNELPNTLSVASISPQYRLNIACRPLCACALATAQTRKVAVEQFVEKVKVNSFAAAAAAADGFLTASRCTHNAKIQNRLSQLVGGFTIEQCLRDRKLSSCSAVP